MASVWHKYLFKFFPILFSKEETLISFPNEMNTLKEFFKKRNFAGGRHNK